MKTMRLLQWSILFVALALLCLSTRVLCANLGEETKVTNDAVPCQLRELTAAALGKLNTVERNS